MDTKDLLNKIMENVDSIGHISAADIPNIDLYMDQVTTFMDKNLRRGSRYPDADKVMTKTMINNYAKNDLLPPPVKKKYSREHVLVLIFIYYYKGILSISDIQTLLAPVTENFFQKDGGFDIEAVYEEVFKKYDCAMRTFEDAPKEDQEFLKLFSFICALSFDVYMKKMIIERLIDGMRNTQEKDGNAKKKSEEK